MANVVTTAETNLIKAAQMAKAREIDFVQQFAHNSLAKLIEVLGVTRKIPMMEGTTMYLYTTTGTLQSGAVPEGEIIPLSQYTTTKTPIGEITLKKWRKAVSAEAIKKSGYEAAVRDTDAALLRAVQKGVRTDFFTLINGSITGAATASGVGLQAALAAAWAQLQIKYEDDTAEAVYFVNPVDAGDYLGSANITLQTAFGMNYIENFLGLGDTFVTPALTKGTAYATAKENLRGAYVPANNGAVADSFGLNGDGTGLIGITHSVETSNASIETLMMSGVVFYPEIVSKVYEVTITSAGA